ncbi:MAG TPA: dihydropteroate synthase, partial [Chitinophagaceae bacterium]|nr:dihydropteroate synthase [Chitinophagaceae bacterium]
GATVLDLGGQSTRPGSERVPEAEERARVVPAIAALHRRWPEVLLSVDTFYGSVARAAVEAGAGMVNDISAGRFDPELLPAVAALGVPYVLMHMKGNPGTMQQEAVYEDVVLEVFDALNRDLYRLRQMGIRDILVDPGFGFAKTIRHNFQLLKNLSFFTQLNAPLLVGLSRKATVYKTLDIPPEEAVDGTTVLHTLALQQGALLLRVHDVRPAMEAIRLYEALQKA